MAGKVAKRKNGRPTAYRAGFDELVEDHLSTGKSLTTFAGVVGVTPQTLHTWMHKHGGFLDAVARGRAKGQAVWEERMTNQALNRPGDGHTLMFMMKNLYPNDFRERREVDHKNAAPLIQMNYDNRQISRAVVALLAEGAADNPLAKTLELAAAGGLTADDTDGGDNEVEDADGRAVENDWDD